VRGPKIARMKTATMIREQVQVTPDPYAPYLLSQAIRAGNLLYVSGQAAVGDDGQIVGPGDFDRQADRALRNLQRVLVAGGSSLASIVKVTIFLTSMSHFPKIVELRRKWFTAPYPADTIVEVAALYSPDAMIEIEAIALVEADRT
jgi:2-iminobutanoate/2-iminopropanoate deaminase